MTANKVVFPKKKSRSHEASKMKSTKIAYRQVIRHRRDVENEQIKAHLSRLRELVPFPPKERQLSTLEVIQGVIEYIGQLKEALEMHPNIDSDVIHSAATVVLCSGNEFSSITGQQIVVPLNRPPLGVLPSNTNVVVNPCISNLDSSPVSSSRRSSEKKSSNTDS